MRTNPPDLPAAAPHETRGLDTLRVRPAAVRDYASWRRLWLDYNAFYGRSGPAAPHPEIIQTAWERFHDDAEPMHALLAELDGDIVGLAHYVLHRSTRAIGPVCYLQDLFVDVGRRRHGAGAALLEAVCAGARQVGAERVYWQTQDSNDVARRLYDRHAVHTGFIVYQRVP